MTTLGENELDGTQEITEDYDDPLQEGPSQSAERSIKPIKPPRKKTPSACERCREKRVKV
ncbi:uncharacterized protein Z520_11684 [Fonsecaea multimorphosa CBS 102226]|uniref:Uncharacterized protein n=1 Tax=Fonsecaea multimorphosa CBS 102226 TaxID=1442371 RepID=A0A0D2GT49_9EURO|nr:uncharacterized protein Z520_11684 [Fonsecaea multimorphosa CBS 102226]KIX92655.1 hypothetical protein Z520_11684 [Fonsecaea multimorphosa CBS 102226]